MIGRGAVSCTNCRTNWDPEGSEPNGPTGLNDPTEAERAMDEAFSQMLSGRPPPGGDRGAIGGGKKMCLVKSAESLYLARSPHRARPSHPDPRGG